MGTLRNRTEIRIGHHTHHCCLKHFALLFLSRIFVRNSSFFFSRKRKYLYNRTDLYLNKESSFSYIRFVQFLTSDVNTRTSAYQRVSVCLLSVAPASEGLWPLASYA
jgi:hypothetical protein